MVGIFAAMGVQETADSDAKLSLDDTTTLDDKRLGSGDATLKIESGCSGPPLTPSHPGKCDEFCDGLGLCSPGRWHPK